MESNSRNTAAATTAAALAAVTVAVMVVLGVLGADGPIWIIQGVLALATAVAGYRAGGTTPRNPLAFAALIVGVGLFAIFLVFAIMEA